MTERTRRILLDLLLAGAVAAALYFFVHKFYFLLFPILLALIVSEGVRASFRHIHPLSDFTKKILIILILLILCALLSLMVILAADRLVRALRLLSEELSGHYDEIADFFRRRAGEIQARLSSLLKREWTHDFSADLARMVSSLLEKAAGKAPEWIAGVVNFVPRFFVSLFIFLFSTYYFSCDHNALFGLVIKKVPKTTAQRIFAVKRAFFSLLKRYGKAYLLLFLLTLTQLFVGFLLIGVNGAFKNAFLISLVDILPVLGTGTILIPWALFCLIAGKTALGIKLLCLYLLVLVVRQIAEPKIVGDSIGLHPVFSLILVIVGLYFFGFVGMIFLPLGVLCMVQTRKSEEADKEKKSG